MQSSPPVRRMDRPASPNDSHWSLDLDALDMGNHSGASTPLPQRQVDRVLSEDIDGPIDFTINMTEYLKARNQPGKILDRLAEQMNVQQNQQTTAQNAGTAQQSTTLAEDSRVGDGIPDSSEWDPHGQASTPQPPPHRHFLQPTVEDYHSELTHAHLSSIKLQNRISAKQNEIEPIPEQSPSRSMASPSRIPRSAASSPTKSPAVPHRATPAPGADQTKDLLRRLEELQIRCKTLNEANANLERTLADERRGHEHELAMRDAQLAEASRRERDLREMKDASRRHMEDFRTEFANQREQLRVAEERLEQERQRREERSASSSTLLHNAPGDEVADLQKKLSAANLAREAAEATGKQLRDELEADRGLHEGETARMKMELQQVDEARQEVAELREQLRSAENKLREEILARETAEENATAARADFERHREVQDGHVGVIGADHRRALELAEGFQAKLRDLQQQLLTEQNEHDQEISRLRKKHEQSRVDLDHELEKLRNDAEAKQSQMNSVLIDRDAAQDDLANSRGRLDTANSEIKAWKDKFVPLEEELHNLRQRLSESESINALFDARLSERMQKREAHWRAKLDVSEQERRLMAKALMHSWGREEVGIAAPQMYEYQFVTTKEQKAR